jgi:CRP-like cAMP-binding protein
LYADGEVIVREGESGASMFLVLAGKVAITVGPDQREVAVTQAGGYFGEMSLLTGDPRTATVTARGNCTVLEITADAFRAYVQRHPEVIDGLAAAAQARRKELDDARAIATVAPAQAVASLRERMRFTSVCIEFCLGALPPDPLLAHSRNSSDGLTRTSRAPFARLAR